jgi:hypothetical protein
MAGCKISEGISNGCQDILRVGGMDKTFWVGYKSDLDTQISLAQAADIDALDFGAYGGLYRFDGQKFSHTFGDELSTTQGGNKSYIHTVVVKLLANSTADDVTIQNLNLGNDIFVIVQDNNQKFFILGAGNGLSSTANTQNSGQTGDSDTSDTVTLSGQEITKKLRFRRAAGYQATLDYLESMEI